MVRVALDFVFDRGIKVVCSALRDVRLTLEKRVLDGPHGIV